jgi:hypothetical protein
MWGTRNAFGILKGNQDQEGNGRVILRKADCPDSGSHPVAQFGFISLNFSYKTVHSYVILYTEVKFVTVSISTTP